MSYLNFTFHRCPKCGYSQVLVADELEHYCPIDSCLTESRPARDEDEPDGVDDRTDS